MPALREGVAALPLMSQAGGEMEIRECIAHYHRQMVEAGARAYAAGRLAEAEDYGRAAELLWELWRELAADAGSGDR